MRRILTSLGVATLLAATLFVGHQTIAPQVAYAACYAWGPAVQVGGGPYLLALTDSATSQAAGVVQIGLWYRNDTCGYRIYGADMELLKNGQPSSLCQQNAASGFWNLGLRTVIGGVSHPWSASGTFTGWVNGGGFTDDVTTTSNVLLANAHLTVDNAWGSNGTYWSNWAGGCKVDYYSYYQPAPGHPTYITYTQ